MSLSELIAAIIELTHGTFAARRQDRSAPFRPVLALPFSSRSLNEF